MSRWLARLVAVSSLVCALAAIPLVAWAHATLISATPADGAVLNGPPPVVSMTFNQAVETSLGAVRVFAPDGARVDVGGPAFGPSRATVRQLLRADLPRGTYTVAWRVISADSHPISGAFTFSIGAASTSTVSTVDALANGGSTTVGVLFGIARWLGFGAFALLVGGAAFLVLCWPGGSGHRVVRRIVYGGAAAMFVATVADALLQGPYGAGLSLADAVNPDIVSQTLRTSLGGTLLARGVLIGVVVWYLPWLFGRVPTARRAERVGLLAGGAALAIALAATWAVSGHAEEGWWVAVAVPADVAHLVAMAVWVGGLVVLALVVLRSRGADEPDQAATVAVARFSRTAFWCVAALGVTGVFESVRQFGALREVFTTEYGLLLWGKVAGFAILVGFGARARRVLRRPAATSTTFRRLRFGVLAEIGLAGVVLAVTALLVNAPPARNVEDTTPPGVQNTHTAHTHITFQTKVTKVDTGTPTGPDTLTVQIAPGHPGKNAIYLELRDRAGALARAAEVTATLTLPSRELGPLPASLRAAGPGHYLTPILTLPMPGAWRLLVTIRTSDIDETSVVVPVTIS